MSCCWNIKRNEGKCIFLFLKQILAPSSCKFCWPAPNKVSWRGTVATTAAVDGLLLLSYFCNDHFPSQGKLRSSISPVRKSYFSFFEHIISAPIQASFAARLLSWTSLLKYFWSRMNCRERIVFDVVCKLSPLDHIAPSGTLDITRPPAGRQKLFALFPFFGYFLCVFWYKLSNKCFFEKWNGDFKWKTKWRNKENRTDQTAEKLWMGF